MQLIRHIQTAVDLMYPPRCVGCGVLVQSAFGLCGPCWRATPFIEGLVCDFCGVPIHGAADGETLACEDCHRTPRTWIKGRTAMLYRDKGRQMILRFKHGDRTDIARPAGHWLKRIAKPLLQADTVIVPVPLHRLRMLKRRYNQSALLATGLGEATQRPLCLDLLVRRRATDSLNGKSVQERAATLEGAIVFNPRRKARIAGRHVLLVDDVMTSGSTFEACTRACLDAGARAVSVVALARVSKET